MCHVCERLGIDIAKPTEEELAREAAEDEAREQAEDRLIAEGKKPRRVLKTLIPRWKIVVEPAPSHDGAPTYAAYEMQLAQLPADPDTPDGYSNSPPTQDAEKHRPPFGIRIYDTTASATADRAALLARRISELTYDQRVGRDGSSYCKDRIEVVALPLPETTTKKERIARCEAHNDAERETRLIIEDPVLAASWFIVEDFDAWPLRKRVFVIHDLQDSWEEALRTLDTGSYDCAPTSEDEETDLTYLEDPVVPGQRCRGEERLEDLGTHLMFFRDNVNEFYVSHFIPKGVLEMELALARAEAAGIEVPRPVIIPFRTSKGHD
ncbi:hypothetical protein N0V88_008177 [Collariella sp. IMI 366227]|nr:hypothetical protein N0V88_008177 [Collariella sp. IMI 366227]